MFVGYNLPIGINSIASMTTKHKLDSMTISYDLKTVTPQHDIRKLN